MRPLLALLALLGASLAPAFPPFSKKEKRPCAYCHLNPQGGGKRGFRGIFYDGHRYSFKGFVEVVEAKKAGVKPNSTGPKTKPTKPYSGK